MICNGVLIAHCARADHPKAGSVVHTGEKTSIIQKDHEPVRYRQELPHWSVPRKDTGELFRPWEMGSCVRSIPVQYFKAE